MSDSHRADTVKLVEQPADAADGARPPLPHSNSQPAPPPIPIIVDCDPGHDDAFALILAAYHPSLDLLGVTTCGGNTTLERTTLNALKVLHISGLDDRRIPVVPGRHEPLMRVAIVAEHIHGPTGLDGPHLPDPPTSPHPGDAATFIFHTARQYLIDHGGLPALPDALHEPFTTPTATFGNPAGVTLVAIGPLTNVALLLLMYPAVRHLLRRVVLMGGAIGVGNVTPSAEFNIFADPEAARIVLQSGLPIVMVPLEVTHTAVADAAVLGRIRAMGSAYGAVLEELLLFFQSTYAKDYGMPAPPLHDPCAVAWVVDEAAFDSQELSVEVDLGACAGRTVVDVYGVVKGKRKNVRVCTRMDTERFWNMMIAAIERANERSPLNTKRK